MNINYKLLKKQRNRIYKISLSKSISKKNSTALRGVLNLLDYILDSHTAQ